VTRFHACGRPADRGGRKSQGKKMDKNYRGVFTVVCTAFNAEENLDEAALRQHIRWLVDDCKVHGIIPCGSTGEFAFLSEQERKRVVAITVDEVKHQVPVIAGSAACSTKEVIEYSQCYQEMGVDGLMIVPSYYGRLTQEALFVHYATIAKNVDRPVIVYNNPGTSGSDLLPTTLARLAAFDRIVAIKESTGIMQRVVDIRLLLGDRIEVLCGCDTLAMEMFAMGVEGWIAAPSNVVGKQCVELYERMVEQKNPSAAWELYRRIRPLFDLFEGSGQYVALAKAGLEMLGRPVGQPRKPQLPPSDEMRAELKVLLDQC
jgi:4-hydroxy-tetrahydrodipicolinate synthase